MTKSTITYWNPLNAENQGKWQPIDGLEGIAEELTLSIDSESGEYTRLTRFSPKLIRHRLEEKAMSILKRYL